MVTTGIYPATSVPSPGLARPCSCHGVAGGRVRGLLSGDLGPQVATPSHHSVRIPLDFSTSVERGVGPGGREAVLHRRPSWGWDLRAFLGGAGPGGVHGRQWGRAGGALALGGWQFQGSRLSRLHPGCPQLHSGYGLTAFKSSGHPPPPQGRRDGSPGVKPPPQSRSEGIRELLRAQGRAGQHGTNPVHGSPGSPLTPGWGVRSRSQNTEVALAHRWATLARASAAWLVFLGPGWASSPSPTGG